MDDPFDSAWFKWGRAVVHAQALDGELRRELEKFKTQRPWTTRTEYDAKHHCVRLLVDRAKPFHPRLGLLIGDTANNFRASLDHLAWALVTTRGKRPMLPKEESRIYFPLALTQEAFDSHFVVTNFLTRADRATLRRYQPYVHGKRQALNHCLPPLPGLNRDDKHRMLRPIAARPQGGGLRVGEPVDCEITRIPTKAEAIILEPGAEVQRIYVKRTGPNPDVYAEADLTVRPTVDGRIGIQDWINQSTRHIFALLLEFKEPPPDEIRELGIIPPPRPAGYVASTG
jgi:hypothetical protein